MEKLNFEIEQRPPKKSWERKLLIFLIVVALLGIGKYFYDRYQNATADTKIKKAESEKSIIDGKIVDKKAEIEASATDFKADQQNSVNQALEIQKERSNQKPMYYEKPITESVDTDSMRDSLDIAMPD